MPQIIAHPNELTRARNCARANPKAMKPLLETTRFYEFPGKVNATPRHLEPDPETHKFIRFPLQHDRRDSVVNRHQDPLRVNC